MARSNVGGSQCGSSAAGRRPTWMDTAGTATHYAVSNGTDTLYATGPITPNIALVAGGSTFNFPAVTVSIGDPS